MRPALSSRFAVAIQLGLMLGLVLATHKITLVGALFMALGAGLGAWSVWTMRISGLRACPEPLRHARLITHGPYRYVRHPMYTALLLVAAGCVCAQATISTIACSGLLIPVLLWKMSKEEAFLREQFSDYEVYAQQTKRLIPWLY